MICKTHTAVSHMIGCVYVHLVPLRMPQQIFYANFRICLQIFKSCVTHAIIQCFWFATLTPKPVSGSYTTRKLFPPFRATTRMMPPPNQHNKRSQMSVRKVLLSVHGTKMARHAPSKDKMKLRSDFWLENGWNLAKFSVLRKYLAKFAVFYWS